MTKLLYAKPALTTEQQLELLKSRGLGIEDPEKVLHLLGQISYYRLSAYFYPLQSDKKAHVFKPNATFEKAFQLYCFDRELRKIVLNELEKIEVAVRTKVIYRLSHAHGPFWFLDAGLFVDPISHSKTIEKIKSEIIRSDEVFIREFHERYSDPLPPSWMLLEIVSFGTLSQLYKNLRPGHDKREIAKAFGLSDAVFETWLHALVYLRNICAHHARLWNRTLRIQAIVPKTPDLTWLKIAPTDRKKCYFMLCVVAYLLQTVNPASTFVRRLNALFEKYPHVDQQAMGFTSDWKSEPLWL